MWRWTTTRLALNKSTGYRWSPLANPPPAGYDRLYGLHATMNTLRVFAASSSDSSSEVQQMLAPSAAFRHPCRTGGLRCLYVRDFSLENNNNHSAIKEVTVTTKEGETKTRRMKVIPPQYTGLHQLTGLAKYMGVPIRYVPRKELVNLCGERRNQNCVLEVGSFKPIKIESTAELLRKGEEEDTTSPLYVLYLDHIIDPTNVGNLMRTCFFYNIDHVILSKDCSGCTAVVSRASTGFLEYLHVYQSRGSTADFIKKSKQDDSVSFIATTAHDAGESGAVPKEEDTTVKGKREVRVLVLGNEDKGLANHVVEQCHYTVHLPPLSACAGETGEGGEGGIHNRYKEEEAPPQQRIRG
ncbi:23S rRNA (guanosine2251-2'-O)-methyltransferase, partial [Angomonas deanei]